MWNTLRKPYVFMQYRQVVALSRSLCTELGARVTNRQLPVTVTTIQHAVHCTVFICIWWHEFCSVPSFWQTPLLVQPQVETIDHFTGNLSCQSIVNHLWEQGGTRGVSSVRSQATLVSLSLKDSWNFHHHDVLPKSWKTTLGNACRPQAPKQFTSLSFPDTEKSIKQPRGRGFTDHWSQLCVNGRERQWWIRESEPWWEEEGFRWKY